jgi:hypothetical protein
MYRIQFFCPRSGNPNWQDLTEGLFWKTPRMFSDPGSAQGVCDSLLWQYHSARVIDPQGIVCYQV